jgi:glycosyltransferase involved in cell wall biosynthesis
LEKTEINKTILLIFPCYNEEANIGDLLSLAGNLNISGYTIVCLPVNDNSKDNTLRKIKEHTSVFLNLSNNLGIGGAVQSGIKYAKANHFDFAIQVDGDGQHPVGEIEKLIKEADRSGCDVCIGSRYIEQEGFQSTLPRRMGISIINYLIKLTTGKKIYDSTSGFRVFNKKAIDLYSSYYPDKYPEPESIVYGLMNGLSISETAVVMRERQGGKSSIAGLGSAYYMVKVSLALFFLKLNSILKNK